MALSVSIACVSPLFADVQYDWWANAGSTANLETADNYRLAASGDAATPSTPPDLTTTIFFNDTVHTNTLMLVNADSTIASLNAAAAQSTLDLQGHTLTLTALGISGLQAAGTRTTLTLSNGSTTVTGTRNIPIGQYDGANAANAALILATNASLAFTNPASILNVGVDSHGELLVNANTTLSTAGSVIVNANQNSFITLNGNMNVAQSMNIGGALMVAGGQLTTHSLDISAASAFTFSAGNITIDGGTFAPLEQPVIYNQSPTQTFNDGNSVAITSAPGSTARPTLILENGATAVTPAGSTYVDSSWIVGHSGGNGAILVSGANSSIATSSTDGEFVIGTGGTGSGATFVPANGLLQITNGATAVGHYDAIIGCAGAIGTIDIDGAGSTLQTTTGGFYVGYFYYDSTHPGNGVISITTGGKLITSSDAYVGFGGGNGTLTVTGSNSTLTIGGSLYLGKSVYSADPPNCAAAFTVNTGANVTVAGIIQAFASPSPVTISIGGGNITAQSFDSSNASLFSFTSGTLTLNGGTFSPALQTVTYSLSLTTTASANSSFTISSPAGSSARPTLYLNNANMTLGLVNNSTVFVGNTGGKGEVVVNGANATLGNSAFLYAGVGGTGSGSTFAPSDGTLALLNGAKISTYAYIGAYGGKGYVNIDGANSVFSGSLYLGYSSYDANTPSNGTMSITNGGLANVTGDGMTIGYLGGIGAVTVDGPGSSIRCLSYTLSVGQDGYDPTHVSNGSLALTNGGFVSTSNLTVGNSGGTGLVTVDGAGSSIQTQFLSIGRTGYDSTHPSNGTLTISNGGSVIGSATSNTLSIGSSGGSGTVIVGGANSTLTVAGLSLGTASTTSPLSSAVLTINSGGLVNVTSSFKSTAVQNSVAINLAGGTLETAALNLSSPSQLHWTSGVLLFNNPTMASSTLGNAFTLNTHCTLSIPGSLTIPTADAFTFGGGTLAATALVVSGTTTLASTSNDSLSGAVVLPPVTLAGSTNAWTGALDLTTDALILNPTASSKAATLQTLQNQILYGAAHSHAGIFSSTLPAYEKILAFDNATTQFTMVGGQPVTASSLIIAPEIVGDATLNGKVDLSDLNIVLNNLGTMNSAWTSGNFDGAATIDLTDLNDVLNDLGLSSAEANSKIPNISAAPEPAALVLLLAGSGGFLLRRRNR